MEYNENWDIINHILYDENGTPKETIEKKDFEVVFDQVATIQREFVRAFLSNNPNVMTKLINLGLITINYFESSLPQEKKVYFKLGELKGYVSLMARIVSNVSERKATLYQFNEFQKIFPYAKDIILHIGTSEIDKNDLIKKMKKNGDLKDEAIENTIANLTLWGFVNDQNYGEDHILYLADLGRLVYKHYTSIKENELFYQYWYCFW